MNKSKMTWASLAATVFAAGALMPTVQGQTAEALMETLVRKGILTEQEAEDLKADVAKENRQYNKWTFSSDSLQYRLYGDFRGRFDMLRMESEAPGLSANNKARDRLRYRLRAGITATLNENFEAGLRLTSGEPNAFGGDPISGNVSYQDNGSKKFVYIDLAYGKWTPLTNLNYSLTATVGKMENPFVFSDMVFDPDYTPEGLALQGAYFLNDSHSLKWNSGLFVLDEINQGPLASDDPMMWGFQLRWDANWITDPAKYPKIQSTFGVSWLGLTDTDSLGNATVPNIQAGNTRFATTVGSGTHQVAGNLVNEYRPFVLDASATVTLEKFPMYPGPFPIRVGAEYAHNPSADDDNTGWAGGLFFGRASKKRTWEISYRYKHMESDFWFEEFVDSDFGTYREIALAGSGLGNGYRAGVGLRGHVVKLVYALSDSVTFGATWYYAHLIDEPVVAGSKSDSGQHRVQLDAIWKF